MKNLVSTTAASVAIFAITALPVLAGGREVRHGGGSFLQKYIGGGSHGGGGGGHTPVNVPEIDASTGLLAVAAILAALAFAYEIRRRRNAY